MGDAVRTRVKRDTWLGLLLAALVLATVEASCFVVHFLLGSYSYAPPTREEFEAYLARPLDRRLGWLGAGPGTRIDEPRRGPVSGALDTTCAAAYGDSFTFAAEVAPGEAWADVLSGLLGCRVANYGVVGYGTDQAFIRFLGHAGREPLALLLHQSENIVRNVIQDRSFIYEKGIHLKPVVVTDATGGLEVVELPHLEAADHPRFAAAPESLLRHTALLPGRDRLAKPRLGFPYLVSVLRIVTNPRFSTLLLSIWLDREPWWTPLYANDHPSGALARTRDIMAGFASVARSRGQAPLLLVLPTSSDLLWYRRSGRWVYQPLLDALEREGFEVHNLGTSLLERLPPAADLCAWFCTRPRVRSGHYTAAGNRLLAELLRDLVEPRLHAARTVKITPGPWNPRP